MHILRLLAIALPLVLASLGCLAMLFPGGTSPDERMGGVVVGGMLIVIAAGIAAIEAVGWLIWWAVSNA